MSQPDATSVTAPPGLIAVNYAARARGVTRHMRVAEARGKCPELVLVHVQTIGGAGATYLVTLGGERGGLLWRDIQILSGQGPAL